MRFDVTLCLVAEKYLWVENFLSIRMFVYVCFTLCLVSEKIVFAEEDGWEFS